MPEEPESQVEIWSKVASVGAWFLEFSAGLIDIGKKLVIWAVFFALLWFLQDFFGLIFLTFLLGFISNSLVERIARHYPGKRTYVVLEVYLFLLVVLSGLATYTLPRIYKEAEAFIKNLPSLKGGPSTLRVDDIKDAAGLAAKIKAGQDPLSAHLGEQLPPKTRRLLDAWDPVRPPSAELQKALVRHLNVLLEGGGLYNEERFAGVTLPERMQRLVQASPEGEHLVRLNRLLLEEAYPQEIDKSLKRVTETVEDWIDEHPTLKTGYDNLRLEERAKQWFDDHVPELTAWLQSLVAGILRGVTYFFLSILFSFLIVWDLPNLRREVEHLKDTKLASFYAETGESVVTFGKVLGRIFQAQAVIAGLNTLLTLLGLFALGIPSKGVLSIVVFFCSFIPVAGVFISSVPIVLLAINQGGIMLGLWGVALITVVHLVEAYILNPRIYASHMKMNPVLTLIILLVSHHGFGLWGVLLGVPVCYYIFKYAIRIGPEGNRGAAAPAVAGTATVAEPPAVVAPPPPAVVAPPPPATPTPTLPREQTSSPPAGT
ncbi:MAG: AI-2E family transporter [Planctomycetes bacterium]|nr:AI-2E family transporter [Planctomycetota bacterium]